MIIDEYKALLCDLDGCLIAGDVVLPGARELVRRAGDKLYVISNNSTDTAETLNRRLARLGLEISEDRLLLAGAAAVEYIAANRSDADLCIYGSEAIISYAKSLGLKIVDTSPDVILLARDTTFSYDKITTLIHQVHTGAEVVVSNIDLTHPGSNGMPVPETGSLLRWINSCHPVMPVEVIGKPEIHLYRAALDRSGTDITSSLCIGDNQDTDGEGANRMGMRFAHVQLGGGNNGLMDLLKDS
jgi:HAD superfamily hydrolase (TIGR01450 family)